MTRLIPDLDLHLKLGSKSDIKRGAVSAEIEAPKASRGGHWERKGIPPSRLGGLRSVVSSPSGVRAEPRQKPDFGAF